MQSRCVWVLFTVALLSYGCSTKKTSDSASGDAGSPSSVVAEDGSPSNGPAVDNRERLPDDLKELSRELDQKIEPLVAELRKEQTPKLVSEYQALLRQYVDHALELAEKDPSDPGAFEMLLWSLRAGQRHAERRSGSAVADGTFCR